MHFLFSLSWLHLFLFCSPPPHVIIILRNCELLWSLLLLSCLFGAAFSSCVRDCEIRLMCPVTGFTGVPLDFQGYKKCETEQIYFPPKQTEKKKKSKSQSEDISQKVSQFVLRQLHYSSEMRTVSCFSSDTGSMLWRGVTWLQSSGMCGCVV